MIFTVPEIQSLLSIVDFHHVMAITTSLGTEVLSEQDITLLKRYGVNIEDLTAEFPAYDKMYHLGKLTAALRDSKLKKLTYGSFEKYLKSGKYIPLNTREKHELNIAKHKTYGHLKGLGEKISGTVNGIIIETDLAKKELYEKVIGKEITRGVVDRKSLQSIVSEIGHKTDDWQRDWGRIVDTEMNNIFQRGRANWISEKEWDVLVYKTVYPKACRHCIGLYLTNGEGSQPILFTLEELEANGSNVGRKVADWKATINGVHPFCRCHLQDIPKDYVWSEEKRAFVPPEKYERKVQRKSKIKITIGGEELEV